MIGKQQNKTPFFLFWVNVLERSVSEEIAVNRRCRCPKCGSRRIDQAIYDRAIEGEWYHCADCGAWYNEYGELDEEAEYN